MRLARPAAASAAAVAPRLLASLVIVTGCWLISRWVASAVRAGLRWQNVPQSPLIASYVRAMGLFVFVAMGIAELNVAREIVIIGFAVASVVLGAVTVMLVALGGRTFLAQLLGKARDDESPEAKP